MAKKDYVWVVVVFGIIAVVTGFFGEIYAILKSTLTNQIILGIIFILGIFALAYSFEKRK